MVGTRDYAYLAKLREARSNMLTWRIRRCERHLRGSSRENFTEACLDLHIVMIWNSAVIMTVTDIAIIGTVGYALKFLFTRWRRANDAALRTGSLAIIGGLGVVASFHVIDLIVRHL